MVSERSSHLLSLGNKIEQFLNNITCYYLNNQMVTVSPIFANLPNGIIREIVSYTGATYKKRNGKYMGQIPKNDIRYALLLTIPKKKIYTDVYTENTRNLLYFHSSVILNRIDDENSDRFVYLEIYGFKYNNDPYLGNKETIDYKFKVCDWRGWESNVIFEYYRNDEKFDSLIIKLKKLRCRRNIMIAITGMFICGLIING